MHPLIEIENPGCISKEEMLSKILPGYQIDLDKIGIRAPFSTGSFQQYRWRFKINASIETVKKHFSDDRIINILSQAGKPALKQFELQKNETFKTGAKGTYWITKLLTIARGEFMITNKSADDRSLLIGYIRLEDLRLNRQFLCMMPLSPFGFSIFEFYAAQDKGTAGSYYLSQQLPGHRGGILMREILKRKLRNKSFDLAFKALIQQIEAT